MPLTDAFAATAPAPNTQPKYLSSILPSYNAKADKIEELQQQSNTEADSAAEQNTPAALAAATVQGTGTAIKNTLMGAIGGIKNVVSDAATALTAPGPKKSFDISSDQNSAAAAGFKVISDNFNNMGSSINDAVSTLRDNHASLLDKGVSVGSAGFATLNGLFSVITAPLATAQHVPGIGNVADGINNLFNAIGSAGSDFGEGTVDSLPVSDETKAKVMPLAQQLGGLAAQILAGKVGDGVIEKASDTAHKIASTVVDNVGLAKTANSAFPVVQAKETADAKVAARKANSDAYQANAAPAPYTPDSQLPTIDMGPKEKSDIPTIQTDPNFSKPYNGEYTLQPTSDGAGRVQDGDKLGTSSPVPAVEGEPVIAPESTLGKAPSAVAMSVRAKQISAGLAEDFKDLPEYKVADFKQQADSAAQFADEHYDDAKKVFLEGKAPPRGMVPSILFKAVEDKASLENDYDTIDRLGSKENKFSNQVSAQAQNIAGLRMRSSDSPVDVLNEIRATRDASNEKGRASVATKEDATIGEIEKAATSEIIPKKDWDDFLGKITCNV